MSMEDFFLMDEYRFVVGIQESLQSCDEILKDLASRILNRKLYDWIEQPSLSEEENIRLNLEQRQLPSLYYFYESYSKSHAYLPYTEDSEDSIVWVLDIKNNLFPLSEKSEIVKALLKMETKAKKRIYFAK